MLIPEIFLENPIVEDDFKIFATHKGKQWACDRDGKIWKREKGHTWVQLLCNRSSKDSYRCFSIAGSKYLNVHTVIARCWVEGYQPGLVVDHINNQRHDNRAENLRWITQSDICKRARRTISGERWVIARVDPKTHEIMLFENQVLAAAHSGVSQGTFSRCLRGDDTYRSLGGYQWFRFLPAEKT